MIYLQIYLWVFYLFVYIRLDPLIVSYACKAFCILPRIIAIGNRSFSSLSTQRSTHFSSLSTQKSTDTFSRAFPICRGTFSPLAARTLVGQSCFNFFWRKICSVQNIFNCVDPCVLRMCIWAFGKVVYLFSSWTVLFSVFFRALKHASYAWSN